MHPLMNAVGAANRDDRVTGGGVLDDQSDRHAGGTALRPHIRREVVRIHGCDHRVGGAGGAEGDSDGLAGGVGELLGRDVVGLPHHLAEVDHLVQVHDEVPAKPGYTRV